MQNTASSPYLYVTKPFVTYAKMAHIMQNLRAQGRAMAEEEEEEEEEELLQLEGGLKVGATAAAATRARRHHEPPAPRLD